MLNRVLHVCCSINGSQVNPMENGEADDKERLDATIDELQEQMDKESEDQMDTMDISEDIEEGDVAEDTAVGTLPNYYWVVFG